MKALFAVLVIFTLQVRGFTNQEMRILPARLLGVDPANYPVESTTYDLRRLRLHGIIVGSHRYQLTPDGLRIALFFCRIYPRLLRL